jgi:hypothetical protein
MERMMIPPFAAPERPVERNGAQRFFGVLGEPRAYGSLFFMLFSLITGIIYFTWAITGISLSAGLLITILGLPFFGLFLFSVQGLALVEGRLVEGLLGVRMPRRRVVPRSGRGVWGKFVTRLKDRRGWTTILYLILKLPLGVITFSIFVTLLLYALQLVLLPVLVYVLDQPMLVIEDVRFYPPLWLVPFLMLAGFLDLIILLHLARWTGKGCGALAKTLLVER